MLQSRKYCTFFVNKNPIKCLKECDELSWRIIQNVRKLGDRIVYIKKHSEERFIQAFLIYIIHLGANQTF